MTAFDFIQKFFVFFLPGIIGASFYNALSIRKEQHYYFDFLNIFVYSFASFVFSDIIFGLIKLLFPCFICAPIDIIGHISSMNSDIPSSNVITAIIISVVLAAVMVKARFENWIFRLANKLRITRRIDNEVLWNQFFDQNEIAVVRDSVTTNTYYGRIVAFSDNSENRELQMEDVTVSDKYGDPLYHAKKLYLSRVHNEITVEVFDDKETESDIDGNK